MRKVVWVKPNYTKVYNIKLPNKTILKVKSGTQVIDRFWGHLRELHTLHEQKARECRTETQNSSRTVHILVSWTECLEEHRHHAREVMQVRKLR